MTQNNFKRLEEENIREQQQLTNQVDRNIESTVGIIHFVSKVVEMYFPRVFEMFVVMTGGNTNASIQSPNQHRPPTMNNAPSTGVSDNPGKIGPSSPDQKA